MLERHAYRVVDAPSAEEALALLNTTSAPIDLLLSSIVLPGMQGPELAATAAVARPSLKALLITDDVDRLVGAANAFGGGWQLIAKPFSAPALVARIQQVLGQEGV